MIKLRGSIDGDWLLARRKACEYFSDSALTGAAAFVDHIRDQACSKGDDYRLTHPSGSSVSSVREVTFAILSAASLSMSFSSAVRSGSFIVCETPR